MCATSDYGGWATVTNGYIYVRRDVQVITFYKVYVPLLLLCFGYFVLHVGGFSRCLG